MSEEDLGIKIGTAEEAEWTKIKKTQEETIMISNMNIAISEKILKLAKEKIKEEEIKRTPHKMVG